MTTKAKTTKPAAKGSLKPLSKAEQAKYEKSKQDAAAANAAAKDAATKPDPKAAKPAADPKPKAVKTPKAPQDGEDTRFFALVKEDDEGVRMQDGSKRTAVFRSIAKAGKKGATIGEVMAETKQELTEVRGACRVLASQSRIGKTKPA